MSPPAVHGYYLIAATEDVKNQPVRPTLYLRQESHNRLVQPQTRGKWRDSWARGFERVTPGS